MSAETVEQASLQPDLTLVEEAQVGMNAYGTSPIDDCLVNLGSYLLESSEVLLAATRHVPRLSHDEERTLSEQILTALRTEGEAEGGGEIVDIDTVKRARSLAEATFMLANQRLVRKVVGKLPIRRPVDSADLMQAGNEGLLKGIRKYDPSKGGAFSTSVFDEIRQAAQKHLGEIEFPIAVGVGVVQRLKVLMGVRSGFMNQYGREPTLEEWAATYNNRPSISHLSNGQAHTYTVKGLGYLLAITSIPYARNAPRVSNVPFIDPEAFVVGAETRAELAAAYREALDSMGPRQREIFELRLPDEDGHRATHEEIAQTFGVTHQRVQQLDARAKEILRARLVRVDSKYASYGIKPSPPSLSDKRDNDIFTNGTVVQLRERIAPDVETSVIPLPPSIESVTDWIIETAGIFSVSLVDKLTGEQKTALCKALIDIMTVNKVIAFDNKQGYPLKDIEVVKTLLELDGPQHLKCIYPGKSDGWIRQRVGFFMRRLWQLRDASGTAELTESVADLISVLPQKQPKSSRVLLPAMPAENNRRPNARASRGTGVEQIVVARATRRLKLADRAPFDIFGIPVARAILRVLKSNDPDYLSMLGDSSGGNCANVDLNDMYVTGAAQNQVKKRVCSGCVLRAVCLGYALANDIEYGIWGGTTERERRLIHRQYPNIEVWARARVATEDVALTEADAELRDKADKASKQHQYTLRKFRA